MSVMDASQSFFSACKFLNNFNFQSPKFLMCVLVASQPIDLRAPCACSLDLQVRPSWWVPALIIQTVHQCYSCMGLGNRVRWGFITVSWPYQYRSLARSIIIIIMLNIDARLELEHLALILWIL